MKMDITGESKGSPAKPGGYSALTRADSFVILKPKPRTGILNKGECTMQAMLNWLADPTVFQVNRLDAHSGCRVRSQDFQAKQPLYFCF